MKKLIKDIANIQTGLFAKPSGDGDLVYLQSKHFDENGQLYKELYPDLQLDEVPKKHLLQNGDVLFAAKGSKNFATVFENHNEPSVASTSFFVIRSVDKYVLPQYLAWFLNNHTTQTLLKGQAIGTSIPSISKQVLENLEITIPEIKMQMTIVEISKLRNKEKSLKIQIELLREKQIQQQIINAIK
ncbi:MAG: restriction endonuclease subunit S [Cytophagaceae bacterium]|nr:restriction endonuclease subunit S [Cytophagaceae bacterium]